MFFISVSPLWLTAYWHRPYVIRPRSPFKTPFSLLSTKFPSVFAEVSPRFGCGFRTYKHQPPTRQGCRSTRPLVERSFPSRSPACTCAHTLKLSRSQSTPSPFPRICPGYPKVGALLKSPVQETSIIGHQETQRKAPRTGLHPSRSHPQSEGNSLSTDDMFLARGYSNSCLSNECSGQIDTGVLLLKFRH